MVNIQQEFERQKLWEFFVSKYYSKALNEVNEEMLEEVDGREWKLIFKGKEQLKRLSNKLNQWFDKEEVE